MISSKDIDTLRLIAGAKEDYSTIKRLLAETQWQIDEDEIDLGFLRIVIPDASDEFYRLLVGYRDPDHPPYCLLTFFLSPDSEGQLAAFNSAFHSAAEAITQHLGAPTVSGERRLSFRTWPYAYQRWSLPEAEFTLMQGEFDIQEGMDVTLWIQPAGTPIRHRGYD